MRLTTLAPGVVLLSAPSQTAAAENAALTFAEQAVVELALKGLTDRAIAEARGCSLRTVTNQLASVYAKLKISGRRQLRARLSGSE